MPCSKKRALRNSQGSLSSDAKEKKATCPAILCQFCTSQGLAENLLNASTIFMTGLSPVTSDTFGRTATILSMSGFWMPMAIMVTVTLTMIEAQAIDWSACASSFLHGLRLTKDAQVADILERPRQCQQEGNNEANNAEDDCARRMISHGIHRNRECQDMCAHDED